LGGILIKETELPEFERQFVALRIEHKLFGEIKWNNINQYYERYFDFIDLFFLNPNLTFHSICFRDEKKQYNAAYILIRTITWKLQNSGYRGPLWVLFDKNGVFGRKGVEEIKKCARVDPKFKLNLEFCNQGSSQLLGVLGISDLLVGALASTLNARRLGEYKQKTLDFIVDRNLGVRLDWSSATLPKISSHRIHFFDPDDNPRRKS